MAVCLNQAKAFYYIQYTAKEKERADSHLCMYVCACQQFNVVPMHYCLSVNTPIQLYSRNYFYANTGWSVDGINRPLLFKPGIIKLQWACFFYFAIFLLVSGLVVT